MAFLKDEDFDDIPYDDGDAFAKLESISRERLLNIPHDGNDDLPYEAILGYMNEITALAEQYNVPDIDYDREPQSIYREYADFTRSVEFRTIQIKASRAKRNKKNSVSISGAGREKIQHHIERLKAEISKSDLTEKRKRQLFDKIADFESELSKKHFNLAQAMTVLALVAATANDFGGAYAGVKQIAHSITEIIGFEKLEDEEQILSLPPREPFRAIPDMRSGIRAVAFGEDDTDIPF